MHTQSIRKPISCLITAALTLMLALPGMATDNSELLRKLQFVNPAAMRDAITDMGAANPGKYPAKKYLNRLSTLPNDIAEVRSGVEKSDPKARAAASAWIALQREALTANPLLDFDRIAMIKRPIGESARRAMGYDIGLASLNAHTSDTITRRGRWEDEIVELSNLRGEPKIRTIYKPGATRTIIDLALDSSAKRIFFARVSDKEEHFRIFEVKTDGTGIRQVTPDDGNDVGHFDPCPMPDGRLIFASTAVYQGLPCEFGGRAMTCLYQYDPILGKVRQLTFEQDSDWNPTMLSSGRIMYQRWGYSDLPHSNSRMIFHMNPDGTNQSEYWGSGSYFPPALFYARQLPGGTSKIVGIAGGHHGTQRSGRLLIVDPALGRQENEGVIQEIPYRGKPVEPIVRDNLVDGVWPQFLHPYPLSDKYFLVTAKLTPDSLWGIYLVDVFDNMTCIAETEGEALLQPMPLVERPKPPIVQDRVDLTKKDAEVLISDIYTGNGLPGVPRGSVKSLRIIEYYFSYRNTGGLMGSIGADGPWDIKRIIGTVPVEDDGSAHFNVPANTPLTLQPLDKDGRALQQMRDWFVGQPGEKVSCTGCHDRQSSASSVSSNKALRRAPSPIKPWFSPVRGFNFAREVQPVLDRNCVSCHDGAHPTRPYLKGDKIIDDWRSNISGAWGGQPHFTKSYVELARFVRRNGIEGDLHVLTPTEFHWSTTELGQMLRKGHHGVNLDFEAQQRLSAWVDLNAPFHGTWGEIVGSGYVEPIAKRARELRAKYASEGPITDYEAIPNGKNYDPTPIVPSLEPHAQAAAPNCESWPFSAEEAAQRQSAAAKDGKTSVSIDLGKGVNLDLDLIPGGKFIMGSADGHPDERPQSIVDVKPFWMGRCEVSNLQYNRFDPKHDSRHEDKHGYQFGQQGFPMNRPEQPVVRVSVQESIAFCDWLNKRTAGLLKGRWRCTLPTEAQWEYAARAGSETPFWFGDINADYGQYANFADKTLRKFVIDPYSVASPIEPTLYDDWIPRDDRFDDGALVSCQTGKYKANPWGLCDMLGNVSEWTRSPYQPYPYIPGANGSECVVRGGSWYDRPNHSTASFRRPYQDWQRVYNVGFRVVFEAE